MRLGQGILVHRALEENREGFMKRRGVSSMREESSPIFIVGPPRSGTELLRAILNSHPDVFIVAETHYFDDLRPRLRSGRLSAAERERAFGYFLTLSANVYGLEDKSKDSSEVDNDFHSLAVNLGGSADSVFVAHCRSQASAQGKKVWGEKTPRHLFRSADILEAFPEAKILVTMRDPRAVIASYRDWNKRWLRRDAIEAFSSETIAREQSRVRMSYNLTVLALLWRSAANITWRLKCDHGRNRIFVCKFEDLLADPELCVRQVVEWIGISYDPSMLSVGIVNSSYVRSEGQGIDPTVADRWRSKLTLDEVAYIDWLTGVAARRLGYMKSNHYLGPRFVLQQLAAFPVSAIRAIWANQHRIGKIGAFLAARLGGLFG
jgi:Sulfotransferase family